MLETIGRTKADFEDEKVLSSDGDAKVLLCLISQLIYCSDLHFFALSKQTAAPLWADSTAVIYKMVQKQPQKI